MSRYLGVILMFSSAVLFAVMNLFVKLASQSVPGSQVAFYRFLIGIVLVAVLSLLSMALVRAGIISEPWVAVEVKRPALLAARGIFGGAAILLLYLAFGMGDLTNITVLNNSYSIFATVFGALLLRERLTKLSAGSLLFSLVGMTLLVGVGFGTVRSGDLLALISSVLSGIAVVIVRELRKTESTWSIFSSLCFFGGLVAFLYGGKSFVDISGLSVIWVLGAAVSGFLAQVMMTAGFRYVSAASGSIISMSTVLFSAIFGISLLGDSIGIREGVGALLLIGGSIAVGLGEAKEGSRTASESGGS